MLRDKMMQNIKNFRLTEPTKQQIEKFGEEASSDIRFLTSEDGQDWYECQALFSDDTIKIMYDSNSIVRSVVDKPVPERGNNYAVSMFFPENMSVAEIDGKLPEGFSINGEWVFNGETLVPRICTQEELVERAQKTKQKLLNEAANAIAPLQDAADLGIATDEEEAQLKAWKKYRVFLNRTDVAARDIEWPHSP